MKDGTYALTFSADGYDGAGRFELLKNHGHGEDGVFKLEGQILERSKNLSAIFNVLMLPSAVHNTRLPEHYSLNMTGTASPDEDEFMLIGTGPLGIIVDIKCVWRGPLEDDD